MIYKDKVTGKVMSLTKLGQYWIIIPAYSPFDNNPKPENPQELTLEEAKFIYSL